jgi:hypothetical protein
MSEHFHRTSTETAGLVHGILLSIYNTSNYNSEKKLENEDGCLLGVAPCSLVKVYQRFRDSFALMMEAARTSETLLNL